MHNVSIAFKSSLQKHFDDVKVVSAVDLRGVGSGGKGTPASSSSSSSASS